MTKRYNEQEFRAVINETASYTFYCWTTHTRSGFCHTCRMRVHEFATGDEWYATDTKISWCNRTWESFRYEKALANTIEKAPKAAQSELYDKVVGLTRLREQAKCEEFIAAFNKLYGSLNEDNKKRLAGVEVHTESQANAVLLAMRGMTALQQI